MSVDLVAVGDRGIDLSFLNDETPPPAYLDVTIEADLIDGIDPNVVVGFADVGVALSPNVLPALVD
jgi:hypothetical protein